MIRIALVGDIGSGKTYYAKLFGYPVFTADLVVAKIYKKNKKCFNKIKKTFPKFFSTFPLKKMEMIKCILANENNIKKITNIIHPIVKKKMKIFINKNKNKKLIILDIPLFLENKLYNKKDIIIFIESTQKKINEKILKRKNFNKKLINRFKKIQFPLKLKKQKANLIIKNKFNYKKAKRDVEGILKKIL